MPTLNDVLAGSLAQAVQVQQIIDALKGTPNKGVPIAMVSLNDPNNYALTVQNDDPTNSRALSVLKADGTVLITADANGVTLGAPLNVPANSISGSQIANASITNAKLGTDTARANLLTNGGFEVWQRGNGPFTLPVMTADRWAANLAGGDAFSISRDTANVDIGSQYCAAVTYTRSTGASNIEQALTNDGLGGLRGRTVTLSVRVKCSTANAIRMRLYDGAGNYSSYHTGGGTYETLTVTRALAGAAANLLIDFVFDASCTAYLDNAMLVVGSVAADYAPLHPADDLARCLRYYEIIGTLQNEIVLNFYGGAGVLNTTYFASKARKAVTPTFTKNGTWTASNCGQPAVTSGSVDSVTLGVTATALGNTACANNAVGANVTLESNP